MNSEDRYEAMMERKRIAREAADYRRFDLARRREEAAPRDRYEGMTNEELPDLLR